MSEAPSLLHLEILGPRASLDRWLAVLQEDGSCHVADAMAGLEGERGIGRPHPTADETDARARRGEAARVLRALEGILPREAPEAGEERPAFTVGATGEGRDAFEAAVREAEEVGARLLRAVEAARQAKGAPTDALARDGARARRLLDAVEDAERREALLDRLAGTAHVVAVRAWVPAEGGEPLRRRLARDAGPEVVVRELAPAPDEPALPREGRSGASGSLAGLAALAPLALGVAWSDIGGGLILLLGGAILQVRAAEGSPRRRTALLAQLAGLFAFLGGLGAGRAFGALGRQVWGTGWGLFSQGPGPVPWRIYLLLLGVLAVLFGLGGAVASSRAGRGRGDAFEGRGVGASLALFAAAGLAVFRLAALGTVALMAGPTAFAWLATPSIERIVAAVVLLAAAPLAAVADAAHLTRGVPYDFAAPDPRPAPPYAPLCRARVGGR